MSLDILSFPKNQGGLKRYLDTNFRRIKSSVSTAQANGFFPGFITPYYGDIADIPSGWALCDGTNGTPDLRGKFLTGAGGTYALGATGGSDAVALTIAKLPAHAHGPNTGSAGAHDHGGNAGSGGAHDHSSPTGSNGGHTHAIDTQPAHSHTFPVDWNTNAPTTGTANIVRDVDDVTGGTGNRNTATTSSGNAHSHAASSVGDHSHTISNHAGHSNHAITNQAAHQHSIASQGDGETHENRPPYFAVYYIMKL